MSAPRVRNTGAKSKFKAFFDIFAAAKPSSLHY